MRVGSLFSGIGGIDLGLERAGMSVIWQSEIDPYASRVLAKHWPHVPNLGDITAIDWSTVERPDLICGGFPCQDISQNGRRAGIAGERSGLWREFARAIRDLRPPFVLVENVGDLVARGLGDVLGDLAALGYDAEWQGIQAAAVGAPHPRERLYIVAYPDGETRRRSGPAEPGARCGAVPAGATEPRRRRCDVADTDSDTTGRRPATNSRRPAAGFSR